MLRRGVVPLVKAAGSGVGPEVVSAGLRPVQKAAAIFGTANAVGFGISATTGSHYHLDAIGTGAFALAAMALRGTELRQQVSAAAISVWATKLAGFLFYRVLQVQHDARLDAMLSTTGGALGFWVVSFAWGWIVSLPHSVAAAVAPAVRPRFGGLLDVVGLAGFAAGFALETAADLQKMAFKNDPATRGHNCDVGVWQLSQHPNYLGNLLVWTGVMLLNVPTLLAAGGGGRPWLRMLAAATSPLFLYVLFSGQASGTIGNSVQLAEAKYGADPRYRRWVAETPLIFPTVDSITRALRGAGK
jgi:steroid 5-alpha reductase family enzyme